MCTMGVQDHLQPTLKILHTSARVYSLTLITAAIVHLDHKLRE
jgi:hypothetical protein